MITVSLSVAFSVFYRNFILSNVFILTAVCNDYDWSIKVTQFEVITNFLVPQGY